MNAKHITNETAVNTATAREVHTNGLTGDARVTLMVASVTVPARLAGTAQYYLETNGDPVPVGPDMSDGDLSAAAQTLGVSPRRLGMLVACGGEPFVSAIPFDHETHTARFVAVGTDGMRPVIWGLGETEEQAITDARSQDDGPEGAFLTVHPCTPAIVARVQHGDVSWRATGTAQAD